MGRKSNPWLAFGLAILVPGLGHLYARARVKAWAWFLAWLAGWYGCLTWIFSEDRINPVAGAGWYLGLLLVGLGSWFDAYRTARGLKPLRYSRPLAPSAALAFSLLFPGLGHVFLLVRRSVRAGWWGLPLAGGGLLVLLGGALENPPLSAWPPWLVGWPPLAGMLSGALVSAVAAIHAYRLGFRAGGRSIHAPKPPRLRAGIWALAAAAWLIGQAPWQAWLQTRVRSFYIPSSSMEPTLLIGDRILAKRRTDFARGDIVVFQLRGRPAGEYLVKRIAGRPGENVSIRSGRLYVDGRPLAERFLGPDARRVDNFGPMVVPEGCYFLLGDARAASRDSRYFGPVAAGQIYGRVYKRYWPIARAAAFRRPDYR